MSTGGLAPKRNKVCPVCLVKRDFVVLIQYAMSNNKRPSQRPQSAGRVKSDRAGTGTGGGKAGASLAGGGRRRGWRVSLMFLLFLFYVCRVFSLLSQPVRTSTRCVLNAVLAARGGLVRTTRTRVGAPRSCSVRPLPRAGEERTSKWPMA